MLLLLAVALFAAACGDDDDDGDSESADSGDAASCAIDQLQLVNDGQLTAGTGEPAFPPYVVDDDPTNQMGFESAVVYAVAQEMGFTADQVNWVRAGFDESIAPGDKNFDLNIQQYTITPERDEVVDFSTSYYDNEQAVVAAAGSAAENATSIDDLGDVKLGASIGSTSLDYIEDIIEPSSEAAVYDDNADVSAAFAAGQIDAFVTDLPTAYFLTATEFEDASITGVLPREGDVADQFGMLFADGNPIVPCVNVALETLRDNGTLEELEDQWLNDGGNIPTITNG
jgi:polar amino acid transport system substrate-binding protein